MIGALSWITYINVPLFPSLLSHTLAFIGASFDSHSDTGTLENIFQWRHLIFDRFEAMLTNEFRTIEGVCSTLVPQGPGYANISLVNQGPSFQRQFASTDVKGHWVVCNTVGALPGQGSVDGNRYAKLFYGYEWSSTWKVRVLI